MGKVHKKRVGPRRDPRPRTPAPKQAKNSVLRRPNFGEASVGDKPIAKSAKMTPSSKSDSDTIGVEEKELKPVDRYILSVAKTLGRPFCWEDFKGRYTHGTIRNAFSRLKKKGLIRLWTHSSVAFYVLPEQMKGYPRRKVTVTHMVGRGGIRGVKIDFGAFLDSLEWEDVCRVHDVCLVFSVDGLYELFFRRVGCLVKRSGDIRFGSFVWSGRRVLEVVLHRGGKVTCYVKCGDCPVEVSLDGLVSLSAFLGGVHVCLVNAAVSIDPDFDRRLVPDVCDWIVAQWHYGRNGACEISGPAFNVTFSTWFGELARIYMRRSGQLFKPRLEIHEKPRKTLPVAFAEKIDPTFSVSRRSRVE